MSRNDSGVIEEKSNLSELLVCDYCNQYPGTKKNGLWNGFFDAATKQHVCWTCRDHHYEVKGQAIELP